MFAKRVDVVLTLDGTGVGTAFSAPVNGLLSQVRYTKPSSGAAIADGSTFTVTAENTAESIWAESSVNASASRAPRLTTHGTAGAVSTFDGTRAVMDKIALADDRIKIIVTAGGTLSGVGTFSFLVI